MMRPDVIVVQAADAEKQDALGDFVNESIRCFEWGGVSAAHYKGTVVDGLYGQVQAGELLAIMGPRQGPMTSRSA